MNKMAFTLAEVLITLGIIGVVAAISMPVLIQNHRRHIVETRLEKFYSSINQAILLAENEFGERENWNIKDSDLNNYEWFNKYLSKYIKTLKIEENENNKPMVYLPDGSAFIFDSNGVLFYPEAKNIIYNTNNKPEYSGIKYFAFMYYPNFNKYYEPYKYYTRLLEPYKYNWDGTEYGEHGLRTDTNFGCHDEGTQRWGASYCTTLIQFYGWKIPKDYPFKF